MNKLQGLEQLRKAIQMFAASLDDDHAMEIAMVYDAWEIGKHYKGGDIFSYGTNNVGDPQLYRVINGKDHTSQAHWTPGSVGTESLYVAIGLDNQGYTVWAPPTGAHDAYNIGDIVNYNGTLYESKIAGNTTVPGTDERFWAFYVE